MDERLERGGDAAPLLRTARILSKWAAGGIVSLALIWVVTAGFTGNIRLDEWSAPLRQNVLSPGSRIQERREGWATSCVGEFGLIGSRPEDLLAEPKIVIWGDSFVEGFHVPDPSKMHRRLTDLLQADSATGGSSIAVGKRLSSVADYCFRIPEYESVLAGVKLHVIHLHSLEDTLPDLYPGARISLFLSQPALHLEKYDNEFRELAAPVAPSRVREALNLYHLQFFSRTWKELAKIARLDGLRFSPGVYRPPAVRETHRRLDRFFDPAWKTSEPPVEAWRFLLRELDAATEHPVLFVYAPPVPTLDKGRLVLENPEGDLVGAFSALCREQGFGFTSLEQPFRRFLEETGRFPKGFHNTRPWEGHYNAEGHRLAAEAIHAWIEENRHVVHPD